MQLIEQWFSPVQASQDYRRTDYAVLCLIIAVGIWLRFWGLGNVGLHGDEETMAMPAMAILETGKPLLPSGMFYARALLNIYLMSASAWFFGESEWAFRLPSAIVGSLTGLAAFFMGRRFLAPQFNLAFVATVTLLPEMIAISQTARMYVFYVTCMIWFAACVFRWERDQRVTSLVLALFVWLIGLHFHTLAIFAAPLFLFPGLSRRSWLQLTQGGVAFAIGGFLFNAYKIWIGSNYPTESERLSESQGTVTQTDFFVLMSASEWLVGASILTVLALAVPVLLKVGKREGWPAVAPVLMVIAGLLAMTALQYHIAAILISLGTVFWLRNPDLPRSWLLVTLLLAMLMTVVHLWILLSTGLFPGRQAIGALIGTPSVWPIIKFLSYSPVAGALYFVTLLLALARFASGRPLPIHIFYFGMAVWAPLLIMGAIKWNIPPRYASGQLGAFLLCTMAGAAFLARELKWIPDRSRLSHPMLAVLVLLVAAIVNPIALGRVVNPGYDLHPDHKGAAAFIRGLDLKPGSILIAEDVLQQTYYLGRVDYSLRPADDAARFSIARAGLAVDQYTGTPVLGTGAELTALLDASVGKDVYVIGSGENFVGNKRLLRGQGIEDVLESDRLEIVYRGRDGKTLVWKMRS